MRKLGFELDWQHFRQIKSEIVPTLFTRHQFHLIEKKATAKKMTASERNEFSRAVSKRIKAINQFLGRDNFFISGKEKILPERLILAKKYLRQFSRKFKNKHLIISGSFLYSQKYNDIDVFIVEKYEKNDSQQGQFQFNYLAEEVYHSLFFASLKKLCVSNQPLPASEIAEKINLDTFISLYQEVFNDFAQNPHAVKETLRNYLVQSAFLKNAPLPDSQELKIQIDSLLKLKNPTEIIKKIFVETVVLGIEPKDSLPSLKQMIDSYQEMIQEYTQHKGYYLGLIQAFQEVISLAG